MNEIETIHSLAQELLTARNQKKDYENKVKDLTAKIKQIEENELSSLMDEQQLSKITVDDLSISKSLNYIGSYTKHSDKEAFQFLYDSNNEAALKKYVIVNLDDYPAVCSLLDTAKIKYKTEYSIHHMTLRSILKELVETGKLTTDDIEKYSVYIQPQIKVKQEIGD